MLNRGWAAMAVAVFLPAIAFAGNNFSVKVGDSNAFAGDARSFTDLTSGTSTTSIIRGDTVTWCWAGDCSGGTSTFPEPHSTSSGVCNPGCSKGAVGGMSWDSGDGYKGTFGVTFSNSGTFTYYCDIHLASMQGTVVVADHGPAAHWQIINQPATSPQGNQFIIAVQAVDRNGNIDTGFNSPATLSVTGANSSFPTSVTISSGQGSASIVLRDIGGQTIQASGQSLTQSTVGVTVTATHFAVTAPAAAVGGAVVPVAVTAEDPGDAVVTGFADPVTLTSSDGAAVLPTPHATLAKGVGAGSATFNTVGSQTLTCTDDNVAGVNGQTSVDVVPASCPSAPKTFSNTAPIAIPPAGPSTPFPSNVTVSGMNGQVVGHLTVTFNGFTANCQLGPGFLLVGPGGQNFVLQNFAGNCTNASSTVSSYTFDDDAPSLLPQGSNPIVTGTFRPSCDSFTRIGQQPSFVPGPQPPYNLPAPDGKATLDSVFGGTPANGTWSLYALVQFGSSNASLDGGWSLTITPGSSVSNTNSIAFQSVVGTPADAANPYPSTISVSGLSGNISRMRVTLNSLTSACPPDLALLLQGPQGQDMVLMAVVGPCSSASNVTLTLDDEAASLLSRSSPTALTSGFYKPASYFVGTFGFGQPVFPPNAPQGLYPLPPTDGSATLSSIFAGTDPNGTWNLYVADENRFIPANTGQFAGGWGLQFELACPPTTTTTLNSSPNPSTLSSPVTFSVHVAASSGTPTGPVTFTDTTTSTVLGSPALDGSGNASIVVSNLSVGSHIISTSYNANYGDNTNFGPSFNNVVQAVNRAVTVTTLSSSVNPTTYNQSVTFTAVVSGPGGTPTGSVTFNDTTTSTTLGIVPVIAGSASLPYATLSVGSHNVTASYSGDTDFTGGTSPLHVQTVNKAPSSNALGSSQNPSTFGATVALTATISSTNGVPPTGSVNLMEGATVLGSGILSSSQTSILISTLAVGVHNITAVYAGDGNFVGSTSPVLVQTVNQAATRTRAISGLNPSNFGQTVTFITNVTSSGGLPTGTVTFKDGATGLGTATLINQGASFTTSALTGGIHSITVIYSGDSSFAGSTSSALAQTVNKIDPTLTLTSSFLHVSFRQKTTLLAVATSVNTPTGTVTFMDGIKVLATKTLVGGQASMDADFGSVGLHVVTALYNGSINYNPGTSNLVNLYRDPRPRGTLPLP